MTSSWHKPHVHEYKVGETVVPIAAARCMWTRSSLQWWWWALLEDPMVEHAGHRELWAVESKIGQRQLSVERWGNILQATLPGHWMPGMTDFSCAPTLQSRRPRGTFKYLGSACEVWLHLSYGANLCTFVAGSKDWLFANYTNRMVDAS